MSVLLPILNFATIPKKNSYGTKDLSIIHILNACLSKLFMIVCTINPKFIEQNFLFSISLLQFNQMKYIDFARFIPPEISFSIRSGQLRYDSFIPGLSSKIKYEISPPTLVKINKNSANVQIFFIHSFKFPFA